MRFCISPVVQEKILPHFEKKSQPLLEKMSNSTYPPDYPRILVFGPLCHQREEGLCALEFLNGMDKDGANECCGTIRNVFTFSFLCIERVFFIFLFLGG